MGDDDGIGIVQRRLGNEATPVVRGKVILVRHHDVRRRVRFQELRRELLQHVVRHHVHRLLDQPQPLLLHAGNDHFQRLARAHRMGEIGIAGDDGPPDGPLLVRVQGVLERQPRRLDMVAVEEARGQPVELVVIDVQQLAGALGIGPHPGREIHLHAPHQGFHLLGFPRVQLARIVPGARAHVHLHRAPVHGRVEHLQRRTVLGAPFRRLVSAFLPPVVTGNLELVAVRVVGHGRAGQPHHLLRVLLVILHGHPGRAQAHGHVRRHQRRRLHS